MKPIKLTLQAFGPFKDRIEIDFTEFQQQGLFLITGPTGSGKTSIFDALLYALYNQVSNSDKNLVTNVIKSQHASDEDLCFVELVFESKNQEYTIRRQPEQFTLGKSKRIIKEGSKVSLSSKDFVLERMDEVRTKITELIGLTAEQFKQIVLLPQGEFKKLLFSDSGDKVKIFRDIFQTNDIERFTTLMKQKVDQLKNEFMTSKTRINTIVQSLQEESESYQQWVQTNQFSEIQGWLDEQVIQDELRLNEILSLYNKVEERLSKVSHQIQIQTDVKEYTQQLDGLLKLEEEIVELNKLNEKSNFILLAQENLKTLNSLLEKKSNYEIRRKESVDTVLDLTSKLDENTKTQNLNQENVLKIDSWQQEIRLLDLKLGQIEQAIKHKTRLKQLESDSKANKQTLETLFTTSKTIITDLEVSENRRLSILKDGESLNVHRNKLSDYRLEESKLSGVLKKSKEYEASLNLYQQLLLTFDDLQHQVKESDSLLSSSNILYHQQQAGLLAQDLQDNQPCPVCGSMHHPNKAQVSDESLTKEKIDELRKENLRLNNSLSGVSEKLKLNQSQQQQLLNDLNFSQEDFMTRHSQLSEQFDQLTKDINQLQLEIKTLTETVTQKETVETQVAKLIKEKQECEVKIGQLNGKQEEVEAQMNQTQLELKELGDINIELKSDLEIEKNKLNSTIEQTLKEKEEISLRKAELEKSLAEKKTLIASLDENLESLILEINQSKEYLNQFKSDHQLVDSDLGVEIDKLQIEKNIERVSTFNQNKHTATVQLQKSKQVLEKIEELIESPLDEQFNLNNQKQELLNQSRTQQSLYDNRKTILSLLSQELNRYSSMKEKLDELEMVSEIALGNKDTNYVSFERFVLATYFEEVLHYANQRLFEMSQQRYHLVVAQDVQSRKRSAGLDLEVFDHYTSQRRSVKTLSGGETFNASLSLALGLSDVMAQKSGGVQIETLFVDEGFGALDPTSLDLAIETLFNLNQSGRLVGIISHVSELKERISAQIVVEKTLTGSHVEIIV